MVLSGETAVHTSHLKSSPTEVDYFVKCYSFTVYIAEGNRSEMLDSLV